MVGAQGEPKALLGFTNRTHIPVLRWEAAWWVARIRVALQSKRLTQWKGDTGQTVKGTNTNRMVLQRESAHLSLKI